MKRFGISESSLPAGSEIRFSEPTVWEQYRSEMLAIFAALLVQAALIGWLIYEHRRRQLAEVMARNSMAELTHMNRVATVGELSASIAHEINQPLTGIVTRASAADAGSQGKIRTSTRREPRWTQLRLPVTGPARSSRT